MADLIDRQQAILKISTNIWDDAVAHDVMEILKALPSVQPEIIRCKDCEYGEQDEVGRWFCRSLGCQIGNEDGSGYCADAERRSNE